jgi:hypothetical protein
VRCRFKATPGPPTAPCTRTDAQLQERAECDAPERLRTERSSHHPDDHQAGVADATAMKLGITKTAMTGCAPASASR